MEHAIVPVRAGLFHKAAGKLLRERFWGESEPLGHRTVRKKKRLTSVARGGDGKKRGASGALRGGVIKWGKSAALPAPLRRALGQYEEQVP